MKQYSNCHFCGEAYTENVWPRTCPSCKKQVWRNPTPVVVIECCLNNETSINNKVHYNPKVLLIKRAIDPHLGEWALPGGYMDMGEQWNETAARELQEETGIEVAKNNFTWLNAYTTSNGNLVIFARTWLVNEKLTDYVFLPNDEVSEIEWCEKPVELAFPCHTKMLTEFFRHNRGI